MNVSINGVPIGGAIPVQMAKAIDHAGGRGDACEIAVPTSVCSGWTFEETDTLAIDEGGYSTGDMRIDGVEHTPAGMTIIKAVSLPAGAKETGFAVYENVTLAQLLRAGAQAMGIGWALYGVDGDILLRRIVRRQQTWPEFLSMIFRAESAAIKFESGKVIAVGYDWAFAQAPVRTLRDEGKGAYTSKPRFRTMGVRTGLIEAKATDSAAVGSAFKRQYNEQVYDLVQAKRTARGLLLYENLNSETYRCTVPLDTGIAAMSRIELTGQARTAGSWFAADVAHEFVKRTTTLTLKRCITTIK